MRSLGGIMGTRLLKPYTRPPAQFYPKPAPSLPSKSYKCFTNARAVQLQRSPAGYVGVSRSASPTRCPRPFRSRRSRGPCPPRPGSAGWLRSRLGIPKTNPRCTPLGARAGLRVLTQICLDHSRRLPFNKIRENRMPFTRGQFIESGESSAGLV